MTQLRCSQRASNATEFGVEEKEEYELKTIINQATARDGHVGIHGDVVSGHMFAEVRP